VLHFGMIGGRFLGKARGRAVRSDRRSGPRGTGCLRWVALLALMSLALPAQPAAGQDRTPTPSGKELWETYPLNPSPTPRAETAPAPSPATARTEKRRQSPSDDRSDSVVPTAALIVLALAAGAGALAIAGLRRRRAAATGQSPSDPGPTSPPDSAGQVAGAPGPRPPDPQRRWNATIEWRHAAAEWRFCVLAEPAQGHESTVLASSEPLEWPPTSPASVQALSTATEKLAASLVSVGWQELPTAGEWYAKRFAWEPVPAAPVDAPARNEQESGRFPRAGGQTPPDPVADNVPTVARLGR
jgi:hypothetical protein